MENAAEQTDNALPDIVGAVRESKRRKANAYPVHSNWASQIGEECVRRLVYHRTAWDKRELPSTDLMFLFDGGNLIEPYAIKCLEGAGFRVFEQQRHFKVDERGENITGKLDLKVGHRDAAYPCEVKGLGGWTWDALNTTKDFFDSRYSYVRKYPAQLLMYMYATNSEHGFFYLVSKQSWQPKVIWINLNDYLDYTEGLLQKALVVNQHVKDGSLPDYTTNADLCKRCDYSHLCNPPLEFEGKIVVDAELEELLVRREELKPSRSEFEKIDKLVKPMIKGKEMIVGDFQIGGKLTTKEVPAKDAYTMEYWRSTIKKV